MTFYIVVFAFFALSSLFISLKKVILFYLSSFAPTTYKHIFWGSPGRRTRVRFWPIIEVVGHEHISPDGILSGPSRDDLSLGAFEPAILEDLLSLVFGASTF